MRLKSFATAGKNAKMPVILIGIQDTCGYFASLRAGFTELGCEAYFVDIGESAMRSPDSQPLPLVPRLYRSAWRNFASTRSWSRLSPVRYAATARFLISHALFLAWIMVKVDAAIFKSGQTFSMRGWDVRLLRALGGRVAFFYVGSDSRPPYLAGVDPTTVNPDAVYKRVIETHTALRVAEQRADVIVANPLSAQFHRKPICIAQIIGNTLDSRRLKQLKAEGCNSQSVTPGRPVRVVHAPSLGTLKGTEKIRAAIAGLVGKGLNIEYIELTGRTNEEVLATLATSDVVIDELYSDSHGGMLAHEASALGVPVLVCTYGAEDLGKIIPVEAQVPSVLGHPADLESLLERLVGDGDFRHRAAQRTFAYAQRTAARSAAARFLAVIQGRAPRDWFFDPAELRYFYGVAGPAANVAAIVKAFVNKFGTQALLLDDKPELRDRLLAFANSENSGDNSRLRHVG